MSNKDMSSDEGALDTITREEDEVEISEPPMYRVLMLNDDFTPMEFVVHILMKFFNKSEGEATRLMLDVHHKGKAVVGVFTREIAETKTQIVNTYSKQHEFPLLCQYERD